MVSNDDVSFVRTQGRLTRPTYESKTATSWIESVAIPTDKIWILKAIEMTREYSGTIQVTLSQGGPTVKIASVSSDSLLYQPISEIVLDDSWSISFSFGVATSGWMTIRYVVVEEDETY